MFVPENRATLERDADALIKNRQPHQISPLLQACDLNYVESIAVTTVTWTLVPPVVNS